MVRVKRGVWFWRWLRSRGWVGSYSASGELEEVGVGVPGMAGMERIVAGSKKQLKGERVCKGNVHRHDRRKGKEECKETGECC